ncbi:hypothetical protein JCM8547_000323 [Rhodosporidiobolus lusitaniae]
MSTSAPGSPGHPPYQRASSRTSVHSIRRKPVPVDDSDLDDASSAQGGSANGTGSASAGSQTDLGLNGREELVASTSTTTSRAGTASNVHRRAASTSSSQPPTSPTLPTSVPYPSHSRDTSAGTSQLQPQSTYPPSTALAASDTLPPHSVSIPISTSPSPYPAALASCPSLQSQRSSVAPESVFGTAPVGVIGKTKPREVIRIERDYSAGETCQFWSGWIWELEGRVSPTDFQNTLNELNTVLASAHDPYKSIFDNCLAILTLYLSPYIVTTHYQREIRKFDEILIRANREKFNPAGLNLLSPQKNAYLYLEIEYY